MAGQGISVGDAVLNFFGDTTQLDQSFAKVKVSGEQAATAINTSWEKAQVGIDQTDQEVKKLSEDMAVGQQGAVEMGNVMTLAGEEAKFSMYEARGEVGLLGEEIGVKLPRHVRSFLVELPGVGAAMSAAFSITAAAFLAEALVQVTEKVVKLVEEFKFAEEIAAETTKSITDMNQVLLELSKNYEEVKKRVDEYGKDALTLALERQKEFKTSVADLTVELKKEEEEFKTLEDKVKAHAVVVLGAAAAYQQWKSGNLGAMEALKAYVFGIDSAVLHHKELDDAENKVIQTSAKLKLAHEQVKDAVNTVSVASQKVADELTKAWEKTADALTKAYDDFYNLEKAGVDVNEMLDHQADVALPQAAAAFLKIGQAMRDVGIDTVDLEAQLRKQSGAVDLLYEQYQKGAIGLRTFTQAELAEVRTQIELAKAQGMNTSSLEAHERALQKSLGIDKQKESSYIRLTRLDKDYVNEMANGATKTQAAWKLTEDAMGSAVAAYAMGSASIGQSLAKMAQEELASLSQRATVKAIEQLALGFGTMFTDPAESATHFTSAAIWGTIGAASAVAGHALTGAAGGGTSDTSAGRGNSQTSATAAASPATQATPQPVQVLNVQRFAAGAIVTQPTLAIVGDSPSGGKAAEGVFPLDDPRAAQHLAGSGGPSINVHVKGMISPDNLNKVVKKINRGVGRGQMSLTASNSHRVTKRSQ